MPAQQDTVGVGMTAMWTTIHVSTHIHTVILTYSVLVTGKVQQLYLIEHISLLLSMFLTVYYTNCQVNKKFFKLQSGDIGMV